MAEKRKLFAEVDKCFKKIDEGVELFEEIMNKVQEANSDNQREKYQDDLKKEIKKLQRLRDQVKVWQTSTEIKDKEKLNHYRKVIEQRMEQFKDIERENKTKPHSKQGLSAEEKLDPKEKEKSETIDWLQVQIRALNDESDRTEMQLESLNSCEGGKRGRKGNEGKKGDKDKKLEALNHRLERLKFHISKLEVVMRMVNNESLDAKRVLEVLKDPVEMFTDCLDPSYEGDEEDFDSFDPEDSYEDLDLGQLCAQLGTVQLGSVDDERMENGHDGSIHELENSRHGSTDVPPTPASPAPRRAVSAVAATAPAQSTPVKQLVKENSAEATPAPTSTPSTPAPTVSTPTTPAAAVPPPPPGIPYNSVAAGRVPTTTSTPPQTAPVSSGKATFPIPSVARQPSSQAASIAAAAATSSSTVIVEEKKPVVVETEKVSTMPPAPVAPPPIVDSYASIAKPQQPVHTEKTVAEVVAGVVSTPLPPTPVKEPQPAIVHPPKEPKKPWDNDSSKSSPVVMNGPTAPEPKPIDNKNDVQAGAPGLPPPPPTPLLLQQQSSQAGMSISDSVAEDALRVLRLNQQNSTEPKRATIPAWLGASPLGRAPHQPEHEQHLAALENAYTKNTLPFESERPRTYLPKIPCTVASYYPQAPPPNGDTLEYYLRLSPETLFFIFYYMEGTKAQLLAAKALKKLSWRFHTKYLTWFQRHEEPKQITDDFEQGTYVYFDFEKWSQRKKEAFTFEYRFLEDKDFD